MSALLADAIDSAAGLLNDSSYVVALVGEGLSAESRISTFRGPGDFWIKFGESSLRGYQQYLEYREWERCRHYPWVESAFRHEFFAILRKWFSDVSAQDPPEHKHF